MLATRMLNLSASKPLSSVPQLLLLAAQRVQKAQRTSRSRQHRLHPPLFVAYPASA